MSAMLSKHELITNILQVLSPALRSVYQLERNNIFITLLGENYKPNDNGYHNENALGRLLLEWNVRSLKERYPAAPNDYDGYVAAYDYQATYNLAKYNQVNRAILAYRGIKFWLYQSCEAKDFETSKVYATMKELESHLAEMIISKLEGGDAWGE